MPRTTRSTFSTGGRSSSTDRFASAIGATIGLFLLAVGLAVSLADLPPPLHQWQLNDPRPAQLLKVAVVADSGSAPDAAGMLFSTPHYSALTGVSCAFDGLTESVKIAALTFDGDQGVTFTFRVRVKTFQNYGSLWGFGSPKGPL